MSDGNKNNLISIAGSIFMLVAVFAKPLHIPDPWDFLPMGAAFVCFYFFFRNNKRIKQERLGKPAPEVPIAKKKRIFWILAIAMIVSSIGVIPLLPYMVENFTPSLYYYVIPAQIVMLAVVLPYLWKKLTAPGDLP